MQQEPPGGGAQDGGHEVGWGAWLWGGVTYAATKADQAAGVAGVFALTGRVVSMDSASGSELLGAAYTGADNGAAVVLDTASGGYIAHEQSVRAQQEAVQRGDVISQIGYGSAKVGGRTIQAIAVVEGGGLIAAALPEAVVTSTVVTNVATAANALGTGAAGAIAVQSAQDSYDNFKNGDIINGIGSAGDAGLGALFFGASLRAAMSPGICFPAGTPVHTPDGRKPIEQIAVGDRVWSYDHRRLLWVERRVVEIFRHQNKGPMATIRAAGETIRATGGHPFWVVDGAGLVERRLPERIGAYEADGRQPGRWVLAVDLRAGDEILRRDGEISTLDSVELDETDEPVYNFRVLELQNYAVGTCGILVHNTNEVTPSAPNAANAGGRVVKTTGTDIEGPYTRLDIGSGTEQALETTLRGNTLHVDWIEGQNAILNLNEVQAAAGGPGSITTIKGYVTDQLAVNVQQPGYIQRFADVVGRRLGGQWTGRLETSGNKTYLILERAP